MARRWSSRSPPAGLLIGSLVVAAMVAVGILSPVAAMTDPLEKSALLAFHAKLDDPDGHLESWTESSDPCDDGWNGVLCNTPDKLVNTTVLDANYRHVGNIQLFNLNLGGQFVDELGDLPALVYFDVAWNHLEGGLPAAFGKLKNLKKLIINANQFSGPIPSEIGNMTSLITFQIDNNKFSGPLPDSASQMTAIVHLHMSNNLLSGTVPAGLEQLGKLRHIIADNNQLSGPLPEGLVNSHSIEIMQLDNNDIGSIPAGYATIPSLWKLSMRNCSLSGPLPPFSPTNLSILDLSFNRLSGEISTSTLPRNLTEVNLSNNQINGSIPSNLGDLQNLQFLGLSNNVLSGDIPANLGTGKSFTTSNTVNSALPNVVVDLQNNSLSGATPNILSGSGLGDSQVWLSGNPICTGQSGLANPNCHAGSVDAIFNLNKVFPGEALNPDIQCPACSDPEKPAPAAEQGDCRCALPMSVQYKLISPSFRFFHVNEDDFREQYLGPGLQIANDQLNIVNYFYVEGPRIVMNLQLFPAKPAREFNQTEVTRLFSLLVDSNVSFPSQTQNKVFGPFELLLISKPESLSSGKHKQSLTTGAKVGIAITAVVVLGLVAGLFFVWRRGFGHSMARKGRQGKGVKTINVPGVRSFSFAEMMRATDGFNNNRLLGEGGYGKVYLGVLENGQKVAIKRAEERSVQGSNEFENEIRLLSRVHHRNLVGLVGYCNDEGENINGEQMLVYEYVPNGNLWDHLNPTVKMPLDIITRMRIALGSARGLYYLHTQSKPPIFHRDIKAANILLDQNFDAKVSDFGLSKLAADTDADFEGGIMGHISTVVKGTPGYLDPEYFQTQRLTDKSDVYSFGVVLLQLVTGKLPFSDGRLLTREVNAAVHNGDLEKIVDPVMGPYPIETVAGVTKLALSCVHNETDARPSMTQVVNQLEELWKAAPWPSSLSTPQNRSEFSGSMDSRDLKGFSKVRDASDFRSRDSGQSSLTKEELEKIVNSGSGLISQTKFNINPR